jgi:hypothetical protein
VRLSAQLMSKPVVEGGWTLPSDWNVGAAATRIAVVSRSTAVTPVRINAARFGFIRFLSLRLAVAALGGAARWCRRLLVRTLARVL